jgi:branched-subunit amino acid aminotransferase/4-amino-4-deoxychorismate lyase
VRLVRIDGIEYRGAGAPSRRELDARVGAGLIETMRARDGRIAHRAWHLGRLAASIRTLGLVDAPDAAAIDRSLDAALAGLRAPDALVRLAVGARWMCGVEVAPIDPLAPVPRECTAITVPGAWVPADADAEHKRTDRRRWDRVEGAAAAAGADIALMTDHAGRLGESTRASVFVAVDGILRTAPVQGLLPGIGRRVVMQLAGVVLEVAPPAAIWRRADEVFVVSALRGVTAVTVIDGEPVAGGAAGPLTRRVARAYRAQVVAATAPA